MPNTGTGTSSDPFKAQQPKSSSLASFLQPKSTQSTSFIGPIAPSTVTSRPTSLAQFSSQQSSKTGQRNLLAEQQAQSKINQLLNRTPASGFTPINSLPASNFNVGNQSESNLIDRIRLEQVNKNLANEQQLQRVIAIRDMNFGQNSEFVKQQAGGLNIKKFIDSKVAPVQNPQFTFGGTFGSDFGTQQIRKPTTSRLSNVQLQSKIDNAPNIFSEIRSRETALGFTPFFPEPQQQSNIIKINQSRIQVANANEIPLSLSGFGFAQSPQSPQIEKLSTLNVGSPQGGGLIPVSGGLNPQTQSRAISVFGGQQSKPFSFGDLGEAFGEFGGGFQDSAYNELVVAPLTIGNIGEELIQGQADGAFKGLVTPTDERIIPQLPFAKLPSETLFAGFFGGLIETAQGKSVSGALTQQRAIDDASAQFQENPARGLGDFAFQTIFTVGTLGAGKLITGGTKLFGGLGKIVFPRLGTIGGATSKSPITAESRFGLSKETKTILPTEKGKGIKLESELRATGLTEAKQQQIVKGGVQPDIRSKSQIAADNRQSDFNRATTDLVPDTEDLTARAGRDLGISSTGKTTKATKTSKSESGVQDTGAFGGNILTGQFGASKVFGASQKLDTDIFGIGKLGVGSGKLGKFDSNILGFQKGIKNIDNLDDVFKISRGSPRPPRQLLKNRPKLKNKQKSLLPEAIAIGGGGGIGIGLLLPNENPAKQGGFDNAQDITPFVIGSLGEDEKQREDDIIDQIPEQEQLQTFEEVQIIEQKTPSRQTFSDPFGQPQAPRTQTPQQQLPRLDLLQFQRGAPFPTFGGLDLPDDVFGGGQSGKDTDGDFKFFRVFSVAEEPFGKTTLPLGEFVDSDRPIGEITDVLSTKEIFRENRTVRNPLRPPKNIAKNEFVDNLFGIGTKKKTNRKKKSSSIFDTNLF